MKIIEPSQRKRPYITADTHARLHHDYATWHPEYLADLKVVNEMAGPRLPFAKKSKFDSAIYIDEAIRQSFEHPAIESYSGKDVVHVVIFDMKHHIGFDAVRNRSTSTVTVILHPDGEVLTAYPGRGRTPI